MIGLYEEPEKPNNAIEYPFELTGFQLNNNYVNLFLLLLLNLVHPNTPHIISFFNERFFIYVSRVDLVETSVLKVFVTFINIDKVF